MEIRRDELEELVRSVLGPTTRWAVRLEEAGSGRQIVAKHPASHGLVFDWSSSHVVSRSDAERFLRTEEFAVADAAPELVNAEAVMSVRSFADAFGWSVVEVQAVAGLLRSIGAISDDEFAWLREHVAMAPIPLTGPRRPTPNGAR